MVHENISAMPFQVLWTTIINNGLVGVLIGWASWSDHYPLDFIYVLERFSIRRSFKHQSAFIKLPNKQRKQAWHKNFHFVRPTGVNTAPPKFLMGRRVEKSSVEITLTTIFRNILFFVNTNGYRFATDLFLFSSCLFLIFFCYTKFQIPLYF